MKYLIRTSIVSYRGLILDGQETVNFPGPIINFVKNVETFQGFVDDLIDTRGTFMINGLSPL